MHIKFTASLLGKLADMNYNNSDKTPYPPEIIKGYRKRVLQIKNAKNSQDLRNIKSLHLEKLKEKKYEGKYSIRINKAWRIILQITNDEIKLFEIIIIEEINNHYS